MLSISIKRLISVISIIFLFKSINAQNSEIKVEPEIKDSVIVQAKRMADAFLNLDTVGFIRYSYKGIIEKYYNGNENVGQSIRNSKRYSDAMGFKILNVSIGSLSSFAYAGQELYTFIETRTVSLIKKDTLIAESYYLAISDDKGKNRRFIDESFIVVDGIKKLFLNYNNIIPVPKRKEPVFIKAIYN